MLNKAGCSVITQMQFVSRNCCCSELKCRERDGAREKRKESSSVFPVISGGGCTLGVLQLPPLLAPFSARNFWQVFAKGKRGSAAIRICDFSSCQYLHSHCYCVSVSKVTFSCCVAQSRGCLARTVLSRRGPRIFVLSLWKSTTKKFGSLSWRQKYCFHEVCKRTVELLTASRGLAREQNLHLSERIPPLRKDILVSHLKTSSNF